MAVPDFQSLMLPLLRLASDGQERSLAEARGELAAQLQLSDEDLVERLPSGQLRLANRVAWARFYLTEAGLLTATKRAHFAITDRGRAVLAERPTRIDSKYLERYPEFAQFRSRRRTEETSDDEQAVSETTTPEEMFEQAHIKLRSTVAAELLARVRAASPQFFERLVVELLLSMGYGGSRREAGEAIGRSGDEGIDGTISEDRLGLDVIYLQAKRWQGTVGRPELQKFVGALHGKRARKGVFLTTGAFSTEARDYVAHIDPKVVLIDGELLAELMIDFDVGVSTTTTYLVKKIDSDYFEEE